MLGGDLKNETGAGANLFGTWQSFGGGAIYYTVDVARVLLPEKSDAESGKLRHRKYWNKRIYLSNWKEKFNIDMEGFFCFAGTHLKIPFFM